MSEKVKDTLEKTGGAILAIGLAMPVILIFTIFVDPSIFEKYLVAIIAASVGCIVLGGFMMGFSSLTLKSTLPKKLVKRIADYAIPVLKSKGEVSLRDIATDLGVDVSDVKRCIVGTPGCPGMISGGYFDDVALRGGLLVREIPISCPYCKTEIPRGQRKCPNCGAFLKK